VQKFFALHNAEQRIAAKGVNGVQMKSEIDIKYLKQETTARHPLHIGEL
jgi:hypothetical protein